MSEQVKSISGQGLLDYIKQLEQQLAEARERIKELEHEIDLRVDLGMGLYEDMADFKRRALVAEKAWGNCLKFLRESGYEEAARQLAHPADDKETK